MTPFHRALARTLSSEGYYTDSGPTYRGIDRRYWPEWSGWPAIAALVEHPGSVWDTMASCNKQSLKHGEYGYLLFSLGFQIGCSYLSGSSYGQVEQCDIWYPQDSERIRKEELRHCERYTD